MNERFNSCVADAAVLHRAPAASSDPILKGKLMMSKKKPVHELRLGRVRAAVWENDTPNGTRHNVTFSRLYRDEQGNWQDSTSFGRDELPLLWKVADQVHSWILQQPFTPSPAAQPAPPQNVADEQGAF